MGILMAMEFAVQKNWSNLWLESDSSIAVKAFKKPSLIPIRLRNRWHNCMQHGMLVICSHIYRAGNCCADIMADLGHGLTETSWYHNLPPLLAVDFAMLEIDMGCLILDFLSIFMSLFWSSFSGFKRVLA